LRADHPLTFRSASYLGNLYKEQGRYNEAEVLYEKVLDNPRPVFNPRLSANTSTADPLSKLVRDALRSAHPFQYSTEADASRG
jgi:cytochrome c-type biogenesis protein CcmH/NrfG